MYHRGGSWHHGNLHRDGPLPRSHTSLPYRGGYHEHRQHNSYSQYHSPCQDRNYNDNQYLNNQEHSYHDESRPYHGCREPRGQSFYRGGRHDNSYQKDFHSGYQQSRPKNFPYKSTKPYRKEDIAKAKLSTPKPEQSVVYNTGSNITLTDASSESVPSKNKSPAQEGVKYTQEVPKLAQDFTKLEENNVSTRPKTTFLENKAKFAEGGAEPSEEDTELSDENQGHSKAVRIHSGVGNLVNEDIKMKQEDAKSIEKTVKLEYATTQNTTDMTTSQPSCNTEYFTGAKELVIKEAIPLPINASKRAHSEDYCVTEDDMAEESFFLKRSCTWQDEDQFNMNKTVEIRLLDGWADMPLASVETDSPSTQRHPEPTVDCGLPDTAKELRKVFILARKEEIELAFLQDCRTFTFVANTLLKKDPRMEVAVTNALRSALQDIAERCVKELRSFVENYDNVTDCRRGTNE